MKNKAEELDEAVGMLGLMRRIRWTMACRKVGNFCLLCPHYREEDEKHRSWIGYDCHWEEDTQGGKE